MAQDCRIESAIMLGMCDYWRKEEFRRCVSKAQLQWSWTKVVFSEESLFTRVLLISWIQELCQQCLCDSQMPHSCPLFLYSYSVSKVRTYLAFFKEETERHSRELMTQPCMARNQNMRVKKTFNPTFSDQDVSWKRQLLTFWPEISTDLVNMNTFLYGSVTVLSKINPPRAST